MKNDIKIIKNEYNDSKLNVTIKFSHMTEIKIF